MAADAGVAGLLVRADGSRCGVLVVRTEAATRRWCGESYRRDTHHRLSRLDVVGLYLVSVACPVGSAIARRPRLFIGCPYGSAWGAEARDRTRASPDRLASR